MKHKHQHPVSCKSVFHFICENLDAEVQSDRCRLIQAHLAECENCAAYLDSLKKTISLYQQYPAPKVSHSLHKEIIRKVRDFPRKTR